MTLCEKIRKSGKKAIVCASAISILALSGCSYLHVKSLRTLPKDEILNIKSVPDYPNTIEEKVDYTQMTWQEAIAFVKNPKQAQHYVDTNFSVDQEENKGYNLWYFNVIAKGETFKYNHTRRKGICLDYATAVAALLSDNDYLPLLLTMRGHGHQHVVFLFKGEKGYGCAGLTFNYRSPLYKTVDEVVDSLGGFYEEYNVANLDDNFKNREWIDGDVDLQVPHMDKWIKVKRTK